MWSFKGFSVFSVLLAAGLLAGCGFKPLYGGSEGRDTALQLAAIDIRPIQDRVGQIMHNQLRNLINPRGQARNPDYELVVTYDGSVSKLAVQKTAFATRANYRLNATFTLTNKKDGGGLVSSSVTTVSSYDIFDNEYATLAAEQDASTRAAKDTARAIATQIAAYFRGR